MMFYRLPVWVKIYRKKWVFLKKYQKRFLKPGFIVVNVQFDIVSDGNLNDGNLNDGNINDGNLNDGNINDGNI